MVTGTLGGVSLRRLKNLVLSIAFNLPLSYTKPRRNSGRLRTLTEGTTHPLACKSALLTCKKKIYTAYNITAVGDYVAVGFIPFSVETGKQRLLVCNWKTENLNLVRHHRLPYMTLTLNQSYLEFERYLRLWLHIYDPR